MVQNITGEAEKVEKCDRERNISGHLPKKQEKTIMMAVRSKRILWRVPGCTLPSVSQRETLLLAVRQPPMSIHAVMTIILDFIAQLSAPAGMAAIIDFVLNCLPMQA